jgi:hypothetical protein
MVILVNGGDDGTSVQGGHDKFLWDGFTCNIPLLRCNTIARRVLNHVLRYGSLEISFASTAVPRGPPAFRRCSFM